ncbi:MAG: ABC transporter permease [Oligoflexia bacterium]|nr:ABC transporter permease [Oligoflexia bacterium]
MRKLWALIVARNKEFYRDRSTLAWTLLFPFIVLAGFTYGYSGRQEPLLKLSVSPASAIETPALRLLQATPGLQLLPMEDAARAARKLEHFESDLSLEFSADGQRLAYSFNRGSEKGKLAERLLLDTLARLPEPRPRVEPRALTGRPLRYADWLLPGLLAMNIMFGSMFGVGYVIVRYRKNGVLKRLRATPLSAFLFLTAQVASRLLLMVVTSLLVIAGALLLIGFRQQGSWFDLLLFLGLGSAAMISLGLVIAARISSEEVADGVLNLMTWPMIFLSGIWFSLEGANSWVLFGAKLMPLTHVVNGLRAIMIDGAGLGTLLPQCGILLGFTGVFTLLASALFRWR